MIVVAYVAICQCVCLYTSVDILKSCRMPCFYILICYIVLVLVMINVTVLLFSFRCLCVQLYIVDVYCYRRQNDVYSVGILVSLTVEMVPNVISIVELLVVCLV